VTFWLTVAGMLAVTFGSRYAGLALRVELPDFWVRCLHFVPIAVFAALVTPSVEGGYGEGEIRLASAGVATVVAWRTHNLGLAIAAGMLAFWAFRWVTP
jgi:branched-subunit amino acid transport protein